MEKKEAERKAAEKDTGSQAEARYRCGVLGCDAVEHPAHWCQHNETLCTILSQGPAVEAAAKQLWAVEKDLLGLGQLDACKGGDAIACLQLGEDLALSSKFKLLERGMEALEDLRAARYTKGCTQCFPAGTKVLTSNSHTKDIEAIQPGDTVLATDPLTGRSAPRRVSRLIITDGDKIFDELTIATPDGPRKLTATYEHPFWSPQHTSGSRPATSHPAPHSSAPTAPPSASRPTTPTTSTPAPTTSLSTTCTPTMCWQAPRRYSYITPHVLGTAVILRLRRRPIRWLKVSVRRGSCPATT